jgi:Holliday junction resolvase RusA-like endonuclease
MWQLFPNMKPESNNILKSILGGMSVIAISGDPRVVALISSKHYSETPSVVVALPMIKRDSIYIR